MELYSYDKYKGYRLFVECIPLEDGVFLYEGVAQYNGTIIYTSQSLISGHIFIMQPLEIEKKALINMVYCQTQKIKIGQTVNLDEFI